MVPRHPSHARASSAEATDFEPSRSGLFRLRSRQAAPFDPRVHPGMPAWRPARRRRGLGLRLLVASSKLMILVALAWGMLFNFSEVRGSSMEPGIHDRDRILVDHVSYMFLDVSRGDVVVLRYPLDPSLDYIKRVIGLPGDEIVIANGRVYINGDQLTEPYVEEASIEPWTSMRTTVRPGHYFVLGDNRKRSSDSREFGQVPFEYLRGKVRLRLWPMDRAGLIH